MHFLAFLWILVSGAFAGDRVWGESCTVDDHCIQHLECIRYKCRPSNAPNKARCNRVGFRFKDATGTQVGSPWDLAKKKEPVACPPFCGFVEDVVYGPICIKNARGCALSDECRKYGRCGFNGKTCVATANGCASSEVCKTEGWCGFSRGTCALTERGCANSLDCKQTGACGLGETLISGNPLLGDNNDRYAIRCLKTPSGCADAELCKQRGLCQFTKSTVGVCPDNKLKCHTPAACVAGAPSPETYPDP